MKWNNAELSPTRARWTVWNRVRLRLKVMLRPDRVRWLYPIRRALLWLALGPSGYDYMRRCLGWDARLRTARMVDIVVRKDAVERRFEADWLKRLCAIVVPWEPRVYTPPPATSEQHEEECTS